MKLEEKTIKISPKLLYDLSKFINDAIFNHEADASPLHENDYKLALKLSKQLSKLKK